MDNQNKFYITTAIPYVNAKPHVGHALEFVQADTIARIQRLKGKNAILLSGSDENALKNVQAAENAGKDVKVFVDENSKLFENLAIALDVEFNYFQKGSNENHYVSSQELWNKCSENGDIYKKDYTGFYCVGCELFYEVDELNEFAECFEHPGKPLQKISESNYFFKLSRYQDQIKQLLESNALKITPTTRKNEMLSFIKRGLQDISISRTNERAKNWGVPVPDDNSQRMYVWFDALNIYRSGLGDKYDKFWPADVHVIGKGITRFHAIYWPAFLMSANLPIPKSLFVHGYFTVDGQKMSKSLGNVVDPIDLINRYGTDALRYYLLSQIPPTDDGNFSEEKLKIIYNADLANGLGNLVSRVSKLCERENYEVSIGQNNLVHASSEFNLALDNYDFLKAIGIINQFLKKIDTQINLDEPWKIEDKTNLNLCLTNYVNEIIKTTKLLIPFMPKTAKTVLSHFSGKVESANILFPRIS